eukprot:CAMPEP_0206399420 /NCGR_PEP_ID=MMETSP0294-20121207/24827_1 /ASSEMBLY_ACC=CAM_ASM_000327 /TAXON_ID=39354 /ORGANISM="Heterosigma akashiwo, Strain CCMP2393" /LENGTH=136 /DNA_ID=CAMNT_0053855253 /DNA_START=114 /DNA_END=521 /DNA_ORIENTATION=+
MSMSEASSMVTDEEFKGETSFEDEHEAFAASRSTDFVYVPNTDRAFAALDKHAETIELDAKPPLVVLGDPGSGKSALLANWVRRRRRHKHREEFLFQHFVGCGARSKQLRPLLRRLLAALNDFFQLRLDVPLDEDR